MKKTRTFVLTEEKLDSYWPCTEGADFAMLYLPVTISVDPEENIELAIQLHQKEPFGGAASEWVAWLKDMTVPELRDDASTSTSDYDPYQTAQQLAMIADYLAR